VAECIDLQFAYSEGLTDPVVQSGCDPAPLSLLEYISILPEIMLVLSAVAVFAILFVTILKVLREAAFFKGRTSVLIALCVALLCIVGLSEFVVPNGLHGGPEPTVKTRGTLDYLLLPYVALAVAILVSHLLVFASKIAPGMRSEHPAQKSERPQAMTKPRGRPKKERTEATPPVPKSQARKKNKAKTSAAGEAVPKSQAALVD
jgi:hypothetical protein